MTSSLGGCRGGARAEVDSAMTPERSYISSAFGACTIASVWLVSNTSGAQCLCKMDGTRMWYARGHATSHFCASAHGRRAAGSWQRACAPPMPLSSAAARSCSPAPAASAPPHRRAPGLRRPDRARCAPRLQRARAGGAAARAPRAPTPTACRPSMPAAGRAAARALAPQPARLRQADEPVDAGSGRRGQLRRRA